MPVLIEGITINQENRDSFFKELKEKSFSVNWPYWAGILDGDGCLSKKTIQFAIIDKEPVEILCNIFKSSLCIRLDSKRNRLAYICQPRYTTQFSGEKYMYLLQKIYPLWQPFEYIITSGMSISNLTMNHVHTFRKLSKL